MWGCRWGLGQERRGGTPRWRSLIMLLPVMSAAAAAGLGAQESSAPQVERLRRALEAFVQAAEVPGATAAVAPMDGGPVVAVAAGLADVEQGVAMTPSHRMPAGSVGKTFVAAVVLSLVQDGVLHLDDSVSRWLGGEAWFERVPNHEALTIRSLLSHTSGIPDHVYEDAFIADVRRRVGQGSSPDFHYQPVELVEFVLDRPPFAPVGHEYHYSDTNYILLGLIVETATGRTYEDLLRSRLLEPLGLTVTTPAQSRYLPGAAAGYAPGNALGLPEKVLTNDTMVFHPQTEWTGGGLVTSVSDLARWGRALVQGRTVLDSATLALMAEPTPASRGRYGLGLSTGGGPWGRTVGHDGWFPGYRTKLAWVPGAGVVVAVQVNRDVGVDLGRALQSLLDAWAGKPPETGEAPSASASCQPPPEGYEGHWQLSATSGSGARLPIALELARDGDGYRGTWNPGPDVVWNVVGAVSEGALRLRTEGPARGSRRGEALPDGLVIEATRDRDGIRGWFSPVLGAGTGRIRLEWSGRYSCP
ncbi:MAG: serine hydrolase domain-containing protein [Gemmatimonadota bacterium]